MTDKKALTLDKDQEEMLNFLRHATKEHPLNLDMAFNLGNPKHRTTLYLKYLDISHAKLIKGKGHGHWITKEGTEELDRLSKHRSKSK